MSVVSARQKRYPNNKLHLTNDMRGQQCIPGAVSRIGPYRKIQRAFFCLLAYLLGIFCPRKNWRLFRRHYR